MVINCVNGQIKTKRKSSEFLSRQLFDNKNLKKNEELELIKPGDELSKIFPL